MVSREGEGEPAKISSMPSKKDARQLNTPFRFNGFNMPHYTQVPDQVFDELLPVLSGAELKVLLYICRRTFGFKKDSDNISLNQMLNGISRKDGTQLDGGTGLSKPTLLRALKGLKAKNIIITQRRKGVVEGDLATNYRLFIKDTPGKKMNQGEAQNFTTPPGSDFDHQQETVDQETEAALIEALRSFGIDKQTVVRLVKNHDSSFILQKIEYVTYLQEDQPEKVKNPRGWLLKAIEDDYDPPAGYRPQADRKRESAEKDIRADMTKKQQERLQQVLDDAAEKRKEKEEKALQALQEQYGTTDVDIELWQTILDELKESVGGLTYASAKAVNLLTIEDDIAFFAAKNKFSVDKINENSIGDLLADMFRKRGYDLKDMKPVIMKESVL